MRSSNVFTVGGFRRVWRSNLSVSGMVVGKSEISPLSSLLTMSWFESIGGIRSESGLVVKGALSVPAWAKCLRLRSRIASHFLAVCYFFWGATVIDKNPI